MNMGVLLAVLLVAPLAQARRNATAADFEVVMQFNGACESLSETSDHCVAKANSQVMYSMLLHRLRMRLSSFASYQICFAVVAVFDQQAHTWSLLLCSVYYTQNKILFIFVTCADHHHKHRCE